MFGNRLILITGAASGIGFATAKVLADGGARLVLVDADRSRLDAAVVELGDAVAAHRCGDVADETLWDDLAPALAGLRHCVVNAGVAGAGTVAELPLAEWRRILSVNLDGSFLTLRAAMRAIDDGSIVVTASASGFKAEPGVGAYGASKAGVIQLMKVAAKEGAPRVRVNAIAPGGVATPIWRPMAFFADLVAAQGSEAAAFDAMAKMATPLGRYAEADEIAAQILFLLSDAAATITGTVLTSDGGYSL